MNNPIRFIDPDGMKVKVANEEDQEMVKLSVSEKESKYVKFDKNGNLDKKALRKGKKELGSVSENFKNLRSLAKSKTEYVVAVSDKQGDFDRATNGEIAEYWGPLKRDTTSEQIANRDYASPLGQTSEANKDGSVVHIKIHGGQSKEEQTETFSHEAYGHAYFQSRNRDSGNDGAYWKHDREFSDDKIMSDRNTKLANHIERVEKLTRTFSEERKR